MMMESTWFHKMMIELTQTLKGRIKPIMTEMARVIQHRSSKAIGSKRSHSLLTLAN